MDWHRGGCPGSLAASPVSPKPSTVNHNTTPRSRYARRWFPGGIQVSPHEAVTLTALKSAKITIYALSVPYFKRSEPSER